MYLEEEQLMVMGVGRPTVPFPIDDVDNEANRNLLKRYQTDGKPQFEQVSKIDWEKATKLKRSDYFATIPSLPISYAAAKPILEALGGLNPPSGWQGGLPLPYHIGPGPAEVHFSIAMDYKIRTIWNVIATLKGSVEPDRWVMLGNHRDAWVYGAVDPGSGSASTLEACRAPRNGLQKRLETTANDPLRQLGRRGIRSCRLDRMGRGSRQGNRQENAFDAQRQRRRLRPQTEFEHRRHSQSPRLGPDSAGAVRDPRSGKPLRDVWIADQRKFGPTVRSISTTALRTRRSRDGRGEQSQRLVFSSTRSARLRLGLHRVRHASRNSLRRSRLPRRLWSVSFHL